MMITKYMYFTYAFYPQFEANIFYQPLCLSLVFYYHEHDSHFQTFAKLASKIQEETRRNNEGGIK